MDEEIVEGYFDVEVLVSVVLAAGTVGSAEPVIQHNSELTGAKWQSIMRRLHTTQNTPFCLRCQILKFSVFDFHLLSKNLINLVSLVSKLIVFTTSQF